MEERIILTFDVGTQSARALLISNSGEILGKKQVVYDPAYVSPKRGWTEQDPNMYYRVISQAARELKEELPEKWEKIAAVTLTTIRATTVCVDSEGKPTRPAIVWLDKRMADGEPKLTGPNKVLIKAVGMEKFINLQYRKGHCNWIMQNEPQVWEATDKVLLLSGYLTFCLTGNMVDTAASMVGHLPYDVKTRTWQTKKDMTRPLFDVPDEKLSRLVDTGDVMGTITAKAAEETGLKEGLPVIATGSDKACEILGLGCVEKEQAAVGFGTTATITLNSPDYLEPEPHVPPYTSVIPGNYTPEFEIFRGYWLVSWFKKEFAEKEMEKAAELGVPAEELLNQRLETIPAGCDGLLFQPYFTPNVTMPVARGALVGFTEQHSRMHVYRAIIEGINFGLMEGMRLMEERGKFKFREIHLGGGGSQSDVICQIAADMFGVPVVRTHTHENTGLGSALAGFVSLGEFDSYQDAVKSMVQIRDTFQPDMDTHAHYERLYEEVYKEIYGKMSPLYAKMKEIYSKVK